MISWPQDCEGCDEGDQRTYGCGFSGHQGQAQIRYAHGATEKPWNKTCPRWCWMQPEVQAVYDELEDYRRGALGNVLDIAAPRLALLRVADAEQNAWLAEQQAQMLESGVKTTKK